MKIIRIIVLYGILLTAFFGAMYGLSFIQTPEADMQKDSTQHEIALKRIDTLEIVPQRFEETITIPGVVEAEEDVTMGASIIGIVEKKLIEEGQTVTKGQELFHIDMRTRRAMLNEMESAHSLAKKNLERIEALYKKGNIPRQDYDDAVSREEQTRAAVERMKVDVSLGVVEAPISGIADKVFADEGEFMMEGQELTRLLQLNQVEIRAGVAERYADDVNRERKATVVIEALNERIPAMVERVAFGGDTSTNTYEVTISLDNPNMRIRPGMIAMIELIVRQTDDAVLIPIFSVIRSENGMIAFVEKDGVVEERVLELGGFKGDLVEVVNGLNAHERIVVTNQKDLVHGQKVNVMQTTVQE